MIESPEARRLYFALVDIGADPYVNDGVLRIRHGGLISPALREEITAHRAALVAYIGSLPPAPSQPPDVRIAPCAVCGGQAWAPKPGEPDVWWCVNGHPGVLGAPESDGNSNKPRAAA